MTNGTNNENTRAGRRSYLDKLAGALKKARPVLDIAIPLFILLIGVGLVLYYILGPSKYYMTGDSTDSLRWAQASFESGRLVSENFEYAAILPFGGNILFYPFIAFFGYSMTAQVWGLALFSLILAAAAFYMATGLGLNRYASAGLVSLFFLIMSSSPKLREIMWEHVFYYNLGILFFCLGIGLVARIISRRPDVSLDVRKKDGRYRLIERGAFFCAVAAALIFVFASLGSVKTFLCALAVVLAAAAVYLCAARLFKKNTSEAGYLLNMGLLALFSALAALNGLQTLVCFSLPVFAGLCLERFLDSETPLFSKKNICSFAAAGIIIICSGIGYMLIDKASGGVTAAYADAYSSYSSMGSWTNNFLGFFRNWFSLIGVSVADRDPLVSVDSIVNIIRIAGALILLIVPFALLAFYKKINSRALRIALLAHLGVAAFILFAVTFGRLGGADWRLTPMLGTSVLVVAAAGFELIKSKKGMAVRVGALLICSLIVLSAPTASKLKEMDADKGDNVAWHIAAEELESRGLKYGYANFWFAETLTLISDNNVQVANIYENQAKPYAYVYQISKDAFEDKEDADGYFLLLTEKENDENMYKWLRTKRSVIRESFVIETPGYDLRGHTGTLLYVYVFEENLFYINESGTPSAR